MAEMAELKRRPHDTGEDALLVPTGAPLYESLSARFIAYDRLVSTLGRGGYSGYVRILAAGANGILLFRNGKMIDALWRGHDQLRKNEEAEASARSLLDSGEAIVDVVDLQSELVDSLHHLASGASTYPDMFASWVNLDGLLAFLKQRRFNGTISVKAKAGGGVLMLRQGELEGAFTTHSRELASEETEVVSLAADPEARIEVRSTSGLAHAQLAEEPQRHPVPAAS